MVLYFLHLRIRNPAQHGGVECFVKEVIFDLFWVASCPQLFQLLGWVRVLTPSFYIQKDIFSIHSSSLLKYIENSRSVVAKKDSISRSKLCAFLSVPPPSHCSPPSMLLLRVFSLFIYLSSPQLPHPPHLSALHQRLPRQLAQSTVTPHCIVILFVIIRPLLLRFCQKYSQSFAEKI